MPIVRVWKPRAIVGAVVVLMLALPGAATADETIGSELVHNPTSALNRPVVWAQTSLDSSLPHQATADGTLTSVTLKTAFAGDYALQVQRPSLGYRVIAQTPMLHVGSGQQFSRIAIATHLPVAAGDQLGALDPVGNVVGMYAAGPSQLLAAITTDPGDLPTTGEALSFLGGLAAELLIRGSIDGDELPTYRTTITSAPPAQTNDATPAFSFTSTVPKTYECRVEPAAWAPCSSPYTTAALADGDHMFVVRGKDADGNTDAALHAFSVDATAPAVGCDAAGGAWLASDAAIDCTASDDGSGLDDPSQSHVTLHTGVAAGSEDANAATDSVPVCDVAGNCAPAGPVSGNKVDRKAPSTACGAAGNEWLAANAAIECTAADGGSGLADPSQSTVTLHTDVPAGSEDADAATNSVEICDAVGHCATAGPISANKVDREQPGVSCGSADGQWHAANVSIACTATDGGSGPATASQFALQTSVTAGTEDATASTGSVQVCDTVANCATAGPVTGNKIDRKTPTITLTTPADGAAYHFSLALPWPVVVSYACNDAGAGVASCTATQANGAPLATEPLGAQAFTVTAGDHAANTATVTHRYTITLWPTCERRAATIVATAGQRTINGTPGPDVIIGNDAAETIDGHGGDDTICAGGGNDTVRGGRGNDAIRSGDGNDRVLGDSGNDLLLGGPGTDDLRGGRGNDRLGGGDGNDRVDGGQGNDLLDEMRLSGRGNDRVFGAAGNDHIRTAGATKDTVDCGPGRDFALLDTRDKQQRCDSVRRVTPHLG